MFSEIVDQSFGIVCCTFGNDNDCVGLAPVVGNSQAIETEQLGVRFRNRAAEALRTFAQWLNFDWGDFRFSRVCRRAASRHISC